MAVTKMGSEISASTITTTSLRCPAGACVKLRTREILWTLHSQEQQVGGSNQVSID